MSVPPPWFEPKLYTIAFKPTYPSFFLSTFYPSTPLLDFTAQWTSDTRHWSNPIIGKISTRCNTQNTGWKSDFRKSGNYFPSPAIIIQASGNKLQPNITVDSIYLLCKRKQCVKKINMKINNREIEIRYNRIMINRI